MSARKVTVEINEDLLSAVQRVHQIHYAPSPLDSPISPRYATCAVNKRPHDVAVLLDAVGPACRERAGFFLHERLAVHRG
ncbi:MAG TPA: hypothetical protein VEL74_00935 [Thermoanaerobaculia bacterium]|nr:hypothetical protein [Thermoanaerobaculia bacterium]